MKKFALTFGLLLLFMVNCFSQTSSSVVLFSQNGEKFWVIFNGIKQNDTPQTNVKVTGLTEPNYKMKVIFQDETIPSIDKMIYTKDYDGKFFNVTYVVKKDKKGNYVAQLSSYDQAQETAAGQYSTPLTLQEKTTTPANQNQTQTQNTGQNQTQLQNTNQNANVQTTTIKQTTTTNQAGNGGGVSVNMVDPVTGQAINMGVNVNDAGANIQTQGTSTTITTTTTTTTSNPTNTQTQQNTVVQPKQPDHYVMPGYSGRIGCPWPMSEADYGSAKQSISSKSFEDTKMTVAKQVLGSNCMTCDQIKGIMGVFSFEDTKLEFAKFAYGHVYDPGNYYKLNDAFTFSSSIDDLNEYISKQK